MEKKMKNEMEQESVDCNSHKVQAHICKAPRVISGLSAWYELSDLDTSEEQLSCKPEKSHFSITTTEREEYAVTCAAYAPFLRTTTQAAFT